MRRTNRHRATAPIELSSTTCTNHLLLLLSTPSEKAKSDLYRGKKLLPNNIIQYTVVDALKKLYRNKCAYCEKTSHRPKIDHHRPKGKVVGTTSTNNGYYWLAYEWTNLLPSCTDCNDIAAKGSKFPVPSIRNEDYPTIAGTSVLDVSMLTYSSTYNKLEKPLLLHPEYCEPKKHFDFDRSGKITGKTQQGTVTVLAIKLDNDDLNGWRRSIYDAHLNALNLLIYFYFDLKIIAHLDFELLVLDWLTKLVKESINSDLEYTLFRKALVDKLEYFFVEVLPTPFQKTVKNAMILAITTLS